MSVSFSAVLDSEEFDLIPGSWVPDRAFAHKGEGCNPISLAEAIAALKDLARETK